MSLVATSEIFLVLVGLSKKRSKGTAILHIGLCAQHREKLRIKHTHIPTPQPKKNWSLQGLLHFFLLCFLNQSRTHCSQAL